MQTDRLFINGINGASGDYLLPPMTPHEIATIAKGEKLDPNEIKELIVRWQTVSQAQFAPTEGVAGIRGDEGSTEPANGR